MWRDLERKKCTIRPFNLLDWFIYRQILELWVHLLRDRGSTYTDIQPSRSSKLNETNTFSMRLTSSTTQRDIYTPIGSTMRVFFVLESEIYGIFNFYLY